MAVSVTAALLVIGDEILSGRTKDKNIGYIAEYLTGIGIDLREVRVVPDVEEEIVAAVNALRGRYTYVFTTGGIGPTHDDITADAIAKAFGVGIDHDPRAVAMLQERYQPHELNEASVFPVPTIGDIQIDVIDVVDTEHFFQEIGNPWAGVSDASMRTGRPHITWDGEPRGVLRIWYPHTEPDIRCREQGSSWPNPVLSHRWRDGRPGNADREHGCQPGASAPVKQIFNHTC